MVKPITGLPPNVVGYRITGYLTRQEYDTVLLPTLEAAVAQDTPIRYLVQIGPGFEGLEPGAVADDVRESLHQLVQRAKFRRTAVVTDVDWIVNALRVFGWMAPGSVKTFPLTDLAAAKAWVAG